MEKEGVKCEKKKKMETKKNVILGYFSRRDNSKLSQAENISYAELIQYLSRKSSPYGQLFLALKHFLEQKFNRVDVLATFYKNKVFFNDTLGGLIGKINYPEIDIGVKPYVMDETSVEISDFAYPYKLNDCTFVTYKPEYKPHIFGIFQAFSLPVWLIMAAVFITITLTYYIILKSKYQFNKVMFHVFATLVRQNALIVPSSFAEKLLIYSWIVGAMILCLSYDSVFLSFLSFPPLTRIKNLSQLASAVQKGDYHCVGFLKTGIAEMLRNTEKEYLRVIANNMLENESKSKYLYKNFIHDNKGANLAIFIESHILDTFTGKFFISEDRFLERATSMTIRRGFCCKDLVDTFVHRIMASGIYFKYFSDFNFFHSFNVKIEEKETTNRKLTLTDVAPAFIFLLCGYFISFLVFIVELLSKSKNARHLSRKKEKGLKCMKHKFCLICFEKTDSVCINI